MASGAGAAKAPPSEVDLPPERVLYIAPGQSLPALVRELYPNKEGQWDRIQRWIVDNNPHAVAEDDPALLRADVRVRLPRPSEFAGEQAGTADRATGRQTPPLRFGGRYLFVDPSQSLDELVPKIYPDERARWDEIKQAIMERNDEVFASMSSDAQITRGTRLSIPEIPAATQESDPEPATPAQPVGEVVSASGRLTAVDRAGRKRVLATGNPVRRHDTVRTGRNGRAVIEMRDGERLTIRADSEVRIREWRLPETGPGERVLELVTGGLRAVTGAIGNRSADDYRTITPEATLGVRGTAYALRLCGKDECRSSGSSSSVPAGLYLGVDQGRVAVLNEAGEAFYGANEFGYVADDSRAPEPAGAKVAGVVYTQEERAAIDAQASAQGSAGDTSDDGSGWAWALGGLLLLGLAL